MNKIGAFTHLWCTLQYPFNIPPAPSGAPHAISDCEKYGDGHTMHSHAYDIVGESNGMLCQNAKSIDFVGNIDSETKAKADRFVENASTVSNLTEFMFSAMSNSFPVDVLKRPVPYKPQSVEDFQAQVKSCRTIP
eukprot:15334127-Ditylum_brightwellii.AAC.1